MSQAIESLTASPALPTTSKAIAQSVGSGFVPVVYHPDGRFERLPRKAKSTPKEALDYASRVISMRRLRTNEARRRLAAVSDPWWVEVVASMGLKQQPVHRPVNRERTGFSGWWNP